MEYKIDFKNQWDGFDKNNNFLILILDKCNITYVITEEDPDIIIYGPFGEPQIPSKPTRLVHTTGESNLPDARMDLNLTSSYEKEYNNIRLPEWVNQSPYKDIQLKKQDKERFCCFVYSNPVEFRNKFCLDLSQYKKVDCAGSCLTNIEGAGGRLDTKWGDNKIEFQKQYKFCIAYENLVQPGYVTEKILHAYMSNCIPIYYGSERIAEDFNKETFINAHDFNSNEELIEYIKRVDEDEELYNSYLNKPIFSDYWLDIFNDPEEKFFKDICNEVLGVKTNGI